MFQYNTLSHQERLRQPSKFELQGHSINCRWLILILFPVGWVVTVGHFPNQQLEYTLLSFLAFFLCAHLLQSLGESIVDELPIWIIFSIFLVTYYIKFYLFTLYPYLLSTPDSIGGLIPSGLPSEEACFEAYAITTYAFASFCLTTVLFRRPHDGHEGVLRSTSRSISNDAFFPAPVAMFAVGLLSLQLVIFSLFNFTRGRYVDLPFHLSAVVLFFCDTVITIAALHIIEWASLSRRRTWFLVGIGLIFLDAVMELLLITSKATLLVAALQLCLLWVVCGSRITTRQFLFLGAFLFITAALYPLVLGLRLLRSQGVALPLTAAVSLAPTIAKTSGAWHEAFRMIFMRLTGVDLLLALLDSGVRPLSQMAFHLWARGWDISQYISLQVFAFPPLARDKPTVNVMPSLLGFFYVCGGAPAAILGTGLFTFAVVRTWSWLRRQAFHAGHAIQAFFLMFILVRAMEGDIDYQLSRAVFLYIAAIIITEWAISLASNRSPARGTVKIASR